MFFYFQVNTYEIGTQGTGSCPEGYSILNDLETCTAYSDNTANVGWGYSHCWSDTAYLGCFTNGADIYFNSCDTGSGYKANRSPVCMLTQSIET
jgi:hypothetical protein